MLKGIKRKINYKKIILELFKQTSFPKNSENCVHDLLDNKKIILYGGGWFYHFFSFCFKEI